MIPLTEPATIKLNEERIRYWLSVGAQPTDTVRNMLVRHGLIEAPKTAQPGAASTSGA
ncbi:MAG: hypothetical protein KatS3mg059_1417 [Thermomicrobiales bacterium]|nr:MAG: hypothetical protein KatS3mg059_1417 [Thermomicrobiales bacterium]